MKRLAIIGSAAAGGAAQIIEALSDQSILKPVCIFDRDTSVIGKDFYGVPVIASTDEILRKWQSKEFDEAVIAIGGDLNERKRLFDYLVDNNIAIANVVDSSVKLGLNVQIGRGNVILNNCYIGNNSSLGDNNYILNQCSIQHDSAIENHNYMATNVTIGAKVKIGSLNRLGIKSIVESRAVIADEQQFKSGSIISNN